MTPSQAFTWEQLHRAIALLECVAFDVAHTKTATTVWPDSLPSVLGRLDQATTRIQYALKPGSLLEVKPNQPKF
jgi:hypothetical protein